ncbi:MAG: RagB/SusD family nutrient uptake outer membrane protein [Saprospiraceae bacterium]|uniref:RagB/SusD family nutrient uptake outer membrane protein n=1 Tax=Candidatus Opimibacter skivensis TaxID=2982028 RepID=A0A9D7SVH8_9BACT|nr:RagB/SusD family nutrient uptake outer membrane protein [Candidatus Opimibacter skivensis]
MKKSFILAYIGQVKFILSGLFIFIFITGCSNEFLDRKPKGQLTFDTFFETQDHAIWATNAVYQNFRSWQMCAFPWIGITDIISDDSDKGSSPNDALYVLELDDFTFNSTNTAFQQAWEGHYQTIFRANLAIINIPGIDMNEALKNRLVGECKFLRAYCYFRLVQWFGDLPLITRPLNSDEYYTQTRTPVAQIYDFIEQDLLDAIDALPEKSDYPSADLGRATKGAARGILAKLYMVKHDFAKGAEYCEAIIQSGEYSLLPRYADNFLRVGEQGAESIFEIGAVAVNAPVAGPGATPYNMIQGVRGVPNLGWGFNRPSDNLVSSYEAGDPRRQATVIYEGEVLPDGSTIVQHNSEVLNARYNQKAWVPPHPGLQDNGPGNIRILRYADILLLAAEANNEIGNTSKALDYINMVRARARGTNNFILPNLTITDKDALREKIYSDRRSELAMEEHRWFDLARWGRIADVMGPLMPGFVAPKNILLPIPQSEIDLSGGAIQQNPGY